MEWAGVVEGKGEGEDLRRLAAVGTIFGWALAMTNKGEDSRSGGFGGWVRRGISGLGERL